MCKALIEKAHASMKFICSWHVIRAGCSPDAVMPDGKDPFAGAFFSILALISTFAAPATAAAPAAAPAPAPIIGVSP